MNDLTLLCVTQHEPHAEPFLSALDDLADNLDAEIVVWDGRGAGCIEAVLDDAIAECHDGYILRLDDDERATQEMEEWLSERWYREHDHWAFPRMNLWPVVGSYITSLPLWPDLQTRLSVKEKAGGRYAVHQGSPFGTGRVASCPIEHHKFLVRSYTERQAILGRYETLQPGAGADHYAPFSLPEDMPMFEVADRVQVAA